MTERSGRRLAVLGGTPAFAEPVHVGRPNIGDRRRFMARMEQVLDRRWLTNAGPLVTEFEQRVADLLGVRHCIAMCNATVALEVVARALELRGEVIVPSFTFIATAHALQWQGITPVFCDIDPATHNIDPDAVETLLTPQTTGILGVHVWGRACDIDALERIAGKHGLRLFFDAAHAFGNSYRGRSIGTFGAAEIFSFHATKFVNSFEGGAVTTNDDALAARVRLMKNFGFTGFDQVELLGTNGKMSEASAAMGLTSLDSMELFIDVNRRNMATYERLLRGTPGVRLLSHPEGERSNFQYVVAAIDETAAGLSRDELLRALWAENVLVRRYFHPGCHRMEPYRSLMPGAGDRLPATERITREVLVFPSGTAVDDQAIERIVAAVRDVIRHADVVRTRFRAEDASGAGDHAGVRT